MDKLARYSDEFINELKENVDIVDLISDYLELKRQVIGIKDYVLFIVKKLLLFC